MHASMLAGCPHSCGNAQPEGEGHAEGDLCREGSLAEKMHRPCVLYYLVSAGVVHIELLMVERQSVVQEFEILPEGIDGLFSFLWKYVKSEER